jgi:hypothetical protein
MHELQRQQFYVDCREVRAKLLLQEEATDLAVVVIVSPARLLTGRGFRRREPIIVMVAVAIMVRVTGAMVRVAVMRRFGQPGDRFAV